MNKPGIRQALIQLIARQDIAENDITKALEVAQLKPEPQDWFSFINLLLLWVGVLGMGCGSIFFVAANWEYMGHLAKFALLQAGMFISVLAYWRFASRPLVANACLVVATLSVGALMALFGQTYQTGADPWQLFFNWAMVTLPWVLVSRFAPMWLLWLLLINLTVSLYLDLWGSTAELVLAAFVLNGVAVLLWRFAATRYVWLDKAWAINLLAAISAFYASWLFLDRLFSDSFSGLALWVAWVVVMFFVFRHKYLNPFVLSMWCLCLIVAINGLILRAMDDNFIPLLFFILSAVTIGSGTYSTIWLKGLMKEVKHD